MTKISVFSLVNSVGLWTITLVCQLFLSPIISMAIYVQLTAKLMTFPSASAALCVHNELANSANLTR